MLWSNPNPNVKSSSFKHFGVDHSSSVTSLTIYTPETLLFVATVTLGRRKSLHDLTVPHCSQGTKALISSHCRIANQNKCCRQEDTFTVMQAAVDDYHYYLSVTTRGNFISENIQGCYFGGLIISANTSLSSKPFAANKLQCQFNLHLLLAHLYCTLLSFLNSWVVSCTDFVYK